MGETSPYHALLGIFRRSPQDGNNACRAGCAIQGYRIRYRTAKGMLFCPYSDVPFQLWQTPSYTTSTNHFSTHLRFARAWSDQIARRRPAPPSRNSLGVTPPEVRLRSWRSASITWIVCAEMRAAWSRNCAQPCPRYPLHHQLLRSSRTPKTKNEDLTYGVYWRRMPPSAQS